ALMLTANHLKPSWEGSLPPLSWFCCAWWWCCSVTCTSTREPTTPTKPRAPSSLKQLTPRSRATPPCKMPSTTAKRSTSFEMGHPDRESSFGTPPLSDGNTVSSCAPLMKHHVTLKDS
ncbi:hypothetical protein JZ751_029511, partial [Albula glossodonta]